MLVPTATSDAAFGRNYKILNYEIETSICVAVQPHIINKVGTIRYSIMRLKPPNSRTSRAKIAVGTIRYSIMRLKQECTTNYMTMRSM